MKVRAANFFFFFFFLSRVMLFQLSLLLTSFRYFRVPFPRSLVRPFCWAFYFCRSFTPLLTLPLRRRLIYPLPVDLLRPYGSVFPFALAERSWVWILLELSPHVGGLRKKEKEKILKNKTWYFPAIEGLP